MRSTPPALIALGAAAIAAIIVAPILFDDDMALNVSLLVMPVFPVGYRILRARERRRGSAQP